MSEDTIILFISSYITNKLQLVLVQQFDHFLNIKVLGGMCSDAFKLCDGLFNA